MNFIRYSFIFLFLFGQVCFAQQLKYAVINTSKGLPSSEVYSVLQDKQGYMWFSTDHGVARFDGKEFTTYTTSEGLADNTVLKMCEDRKGRVWFASQSMELCYWEKGVIHKSPASETMRKNMVSSYVPSRLYVDSADNIWVNSMQERFCIKAEKNYTTFVKTLLTNPSTFAQLVLIENVPMVNLGKYTKKNVKEGVQRSVEFNCHKINEADHYFYSYIKKEDVRIPIYITPNTVSKKNVFYIGLNNLLFIFEQGKVTKQKKFPHAILSLVVDKNNDLWIGFRRGGACCYKQCDLDTRPVALQEECSASDIYTDHEGGIWIASLEKGVIYIPSPSILTYSNLSYLNDHIIFVGPVKNQLMVNTFNNSICREQDQTFKPDEFLCDLGKTRAGLFYMAHINDTTYYSYGYELIRFTPAYLPLRKKLNRAFFCGGKIIFSTDDKSIWILCANGVRKINNQIDSCLIYSLPARTISALPDGNAIWVGTKKGLYKFQDGTYTNFTEIDTLLQCEITDLAKDADGSLWLATVGNGVLRLKNKKVESFKTADGLVSNVCTSIKIDQQKNIWVGTNKGLGCLIPASKNKWSIKNITEQNGLNSNEITKLCVLNDTLWIGTMYGLSSLDIKQMTRYIVPSSIYINSIKVNNNELTSDTTQFSYNENNFTFALNGLTFKDNGNHLYRYRLIGSDTTWHQIQSNELLLNNLAPGQYTFEAQVANLDKIWSTKSAIFSFTIHKPFWLTWWFILIEIVVLILIVYAIILWRTSIIRKKEQEKLRINKLLAEYQMKALTAQMNPHFIFNAINSIQNFIIQNHSTLAYDYLIKFSKLIRLVLNNSKENEVTLQQELETLDLYIELEQLRFEKSFDYLLTIAPEIDPQSLMIPGLLLQPYIENAIWHGLMPLKTRKGEIALTITEEDSLLKIIIKDNGVGRKASDLIKKKIIHKSHQSVGMELTGKRIELFGQENKFSLQIIDNYDDQENATGTTVQIILPMIEMY